MFIDPRPLMLGEHVPVGMHHLLGYPVDRRRAGCQQLTGVVVSALDGPQQRSSAAGN